MDKHKNPKSLLIKYEQSLAYQRNYYHTKLDKDKLKQQKRESYRKKRGNILQLLGNKTQIIFIEGNIGAGKSTLLKHIQANYEDVQVLLETVEDWNKPLDETGVGILELFYKDPSKYAFMFQYFVMSNRLKQFEKIDYTKKIVFIERSMHTSRNVFMQNMIDSGFITSLEKAIYDETFEYLLNKLNINNAKYIYLFVPVQTCFERIKKRNRTGEQEIPIEYLQKIHDKHIEWFNQMIKKGIEADFYMVKPENDLNEFNLIQMLGLEGFEKKLL